MIKKLWFKYKELFFYGVFGVGATVINIVSYRVLANIFGKKYFLIANIIAWILAFIFAFITNKLFVFERYRPELFEPVILSPAVKVYKLKR